MIHLKNKIKKQFTSEFGIHFTRSQLQRAEKFLDEVVEVVLNRVRKIVGKDLRKKGEELTCECDGLYYCDCEFTKEDTLLEILTKLKDL